MLPISTIYIKVRQWPLIFLYLLCCAPCVLVGLLEDGTEDHLQKVGILCFIVFTHLLFLFFWYSVSKIIIEIYNDSLVYKTAFKIKEIAWRTITESELEFIIHERGGNVIWIFVSPEVIIKIDPTYFSKKGNRIIAEVLVGKCRDAKISTNIKAMANGKFPWYLF